MAANFVPPFPGSHVITVVAAQNPKRRSAAVRFALYRSGMTVAGYVRAITTRKLNGGKKIAYRDLQWDAKQGHITLTPATE